MRPFYLATVLVLISLTTPLGLFASIQPSETSWIDIPAFDGPKLKLSTESFTNHSDAKKHCKDNAMTIANSGPATLMTLAMSGALLMDKALMEAFSFEFFIKGKLAESGLWGWSNQEDSVFLMFDGRGVNLEVYNELEVREHLIMFDNHTLNLPVLCQKN